MCALFLPPVGATFPELQFSCTALGKSRTRKQMAAHLKMKRLCRGLQGA